jgi:pimeloyl-ACP methyl ester carboxylesterase
LEGGDEDTNDSYRFAEADLAALTRTCVYDRANLGRSDPAPGPRGLTDLVGDLERLLAAAEVGGPYVLVGTSGGGYITAGFAAAHPDEIAGMVFVEVPSPFVDPPKEILELTAWDHPRNVERRDYLQVERDAWAARQEIGDIPVMVISNDYGPNAELPGERTNVQDQQGWLVLSPRAEQIVVTTGHAVEETDPQLVIDTILDVVAAARTHEDDTEEPAVQTAATTAPSSVAESAPASEPHPDGRIAFGRIMPGHEQTDQLMALYAIDADGTDEIQLTDGNSFGPAWSPDGTRLAFTLVADDGSSQIATVAGAGTVGHVPASGPCVQD